MGKKKCKGHVEEENAERQTDLVLRLRAAGQGAGEAEKKTQCLTPGTSSQECFPGTTLESD